MKTLNGKNRGGRPPMSPIKKLAVQMMVKFTIPDSIRLQRAAEARGITANEFVRRAALCALEVGP